MLKERSNKLETAREIENIKEKSSEFLLKRQNNFPIMKLNYIAHSALKD